MNQKNATGGAIQDSSEDAVDVPFGVMVTGATTPVGVGLLRSLLEDEKVGRVVGIGAEAATDAVELPSHSKLTYIQVDLTRSRGLRHLLFGPARDLGVEVIIHTAQHRCARDVGRKVHALNVESTRELLHLSEKHPTIRRFIFRSYGEIYKLRAELPSLIEEQHPFSIEPEIPQWLRDRVEADLTVCTRMGLSPLHIMVLRTAECFAKGTGSQLYDYLNSRICFRPLGFDPMLNLLTVEDLVRALHRSIYCPSQGIFNIPGRDTLPLSQVIQKVGRADIPVPGPLLTPLYKARSLFRGTDFRYDMNRWRFHFNAVLDGRRAAQEMGYSPEHPVDWSSVYCS